MREAGSRTIGVQGASTMIGRHLVTRIRRMGLRAVAVCLTADDVAGAVAVGIEPRQPDLSDPVAGAAAFADLDAVICVDRLPDEAFRDSRNGDPHANRRRVMAALFKSCQAAGVPRIVWLGNPASLAPVAEPGRKNSNARPTLRTRKTGFDSPGALARYELDRFVQEHAALGLPVNLVFAPTVIGEYDGNYSMGRVLLGLARGEIARIADAPKEVAHPDDVARGLLLAAERGEPGRCYVLGGHRTRMAHIARYVSLRCKQPTPRAMSAAELTLRRLLLQAGKSGTRVEDVRTMGLMATPQRFDARLAQSALGYRPRVGLRETLDRGLKWIERTSGGRSASSAPAARVMGAGERAFAVTVFASSGRKTARRSGTPAALRTPRPIRRRAVETQATSASATAGTRGARSGPVMRRPPLPETISGRGSDG